MTEPKSNLVPIQCPSCGTQYEAPVISVIDVGVAPQLRQALLAGQLNVATCPNCKAGGVLEVPLVYHDPKEEFLAVYFPQQLNLPEQQKQKMIGELTQALMRSLPQEQRKGYFFNPRQFVSRQSLLDAVLGTMGISQEELDRQRKKAKLVEQLMVFGDDPKGLQMMIKGQDSQLDLEFFGILDGMLQQALAINDEKSAKKLETLRESLMPITTFGQKAAKQRAAVESLKDVKTPEEFLDRMLRADHDDATAIAVSARPALDYAFFQALSARIEAAQGAEKDRLTQLRSHLLELTEQLDKVAQEGIQEAVELLNEIIGSGSPRATLRAHVDEIDDLFMQVLSANLQEAERKGDKELVSRLQMVNEEIMNLVVESLPAPVRLINELLATKTPEEARAMLQARRSEITPEVTDLMGRMADEISDRGEEAAETVKRLREIRAQALLLI